MILQLGVKPHWFNTCSTTKDKRHHLIPGTASGAGDLRSYMIDSPPVGDSVVPEMLLKVLEPYRKEGGFLSSMVVVFSFKGFALEHLIISSYLLLIFHHTRLHT